MANSPEYPDLPWMPPASWTNANRTSVQLIVIHTTEGSEGPASAEDGAAYDQRRTDGTSTHFFHDQDSTVQCVRTEDIAHAARHQGNLRGIQHELCGRAGQTAAQWNDTASQGTLRQAARQCARDARKWGIPVRHLTVAEVADGVKGFCGHYDITRAFPQDNGTHTDPGPDFPWSDFLDLVRTEMEILDMDEASIAQAVASKLFADLSNKDSGLFKSFVARTKDGVVSVLSDGNTAAVGLAPDGDAGRPYRFVRDALRNIVGGPIDQGTILAAAAKAADVDEQALAAALVQPLAEAVAGRLPLDQAGLTQADVEAAVRNVLVSGTGAA